MYGIIECEKSIYYIAFIETRTFAYTNIENLLKRNEMYEWRTTNVRVRRN